MENIEQPDRPQTKIRWMLIAFWITKATKYTISVYVTIIVFHGNNVKANALQCYIVLTFVRLFYFKKSGTSASSNVERKRNT